MKTTNLIVWAQVNIINSKSQQYACCSLIILDMFNNQIPKFGTRRSLCFVENWTMMLNNLISTQREEHETRRDLALSFGERQVESK